MVAKEYIFLVLVFVMTDPSPLFCVDPKGGMQDGSRASVSDWLWRRVGCGCAIAKEGDDIEDWRLT